MYLDELAEVTKEVLKQKINLKTILIDLSVINNCGSSAVEDIGIMSAIVSFYALELQKRGLEINDIFRSMTFIFGVSNNLFMEISKLRAARFVFSKLAEAFEIKPENAKMRMHVRTSRYTKTQYDPWVNILRTSTEAFSAIIGGCDSLNVTPYDCVIGKEDEFSRRIARNQQLVLKEETHLNAVIDPAGGSYYVESLTNEIIQKSWEYFLSIEDKGGLIECLKDGSIQNRINQTHATRLKYAETRKDAVVGSTTFANLNEKKIEKTVPSIKKPVSKGNKEDVLPNDFNGLLSVIDKYSIDNFCAAKRRNTAVSIEIEKLKKRRLTETFEAIREKVTALPKPIEVFVANIGKTVKNKPRVDFAISFFEPFGFVCNTNDGFENVDNAVAEVAKKAAQVIVLSSTDDLYPEVVPAFAKALKEKAPEKVLCLAGYPKEHIEAFTKSGVDFYVYMRANLVTTVTDVLGKLGIN
ncbi:MAG: methylmalonyl-CoA mutase family protein [Candidatus Cloacimonetes bacterium]|nr:methylmalonyl-CoA mutase family protein [Candidatus Cloacimonadota bacterium]